MKADFPSPCVCVRPFEFFAFVRRHLGAGAITDTFGIRESQAHRYCQNPDMLHDQTRRTPLDNLRALFGTVQEIQAGLHG